MILALALAAAQPVAAPVMPAPQEAAPATVDPARLAAARALIDTLMPPATRAQLIDGMMAPMLANIRQGMTQDPAFQKALGSDPRVQTLFDQFMAKQNARTVAEMRAALPGMTEAMAHAYARRFDVTQMRELKAFFETPTGRTYMQASYTIMSDPDIAAWQRTLMTRSMGMIQADVAELAKQVQALETSPPAR